MLIVIPTPRMQGVAALRHVRIEQILPREFVKLPKGLGNAYIQMKPNAVRFIQEGLACAARDKRLLCDFSPFNFFVFFELDPRNCIWANWEPWSCPEDGCLGVVSKLVTRNRQKRVVERYDGYCNGSPSENELCRKHCPSNLLQFNFNSHSEVSD